MKQKGSFLKIFLAIFGAIIYITAIFVAVKYPDSDYHFTLTMALLIIGTGFTGASLPFKSKNSTMPKESTPFNEDDMFQEQDHIEEEIINEPKENKKLYKAFRIYSFVIGVLALIGSVIVFALKASSSEDYKGMAILLLIIGLIFTVLSLLSKEK